MTVTGYHLCLLPLGLSWCFTKKWPSINILTVYDKLMGKKNASSLHTHTHRFMFDK